MGYDGFLLRVWFAVVMVGCRVDHGGFVEANRGCGGGGGFLDDPSGPGSWVTLFNHWLQRNNNNINNNNK